MIRKLLTLALVLIAGLHLATPLFAQAAEATCTCFCGEEGYGAIALETKITAAKCQAQCLDLGAKPVVCASGPAEYPSMTASCFTPEMCERQNGEIDPDYQPAECLPGDHYCYPTEMKEVKLAVAIGTLTSVTSLGVYVQAFYKYGLSVAVTIAIVMVMIGGLQYVLAAGSGNVEKGKTRIKNAVIGLVLLLFAYVILYTVNPRLVNLRLPELPMVRRVELTSSATSCESYLGIVDTNSNTPDKNSPNKGKPYKLGEEDAGANGAKKCGTIAEILEKNDGTAVPQGSTCEYITCSTAGARCAGSGDQAKCLECAKVVPNSISGLALDSALCSALEKPDTQDGNGDPAMVNYCSFTHDPNLLVSNWFYGAYAIAPITGVSGLIANYYVISNSDQLLLANGACAELTLDCGSIDECGGYDNEMVHTAITSNELDDLVQSGFFMSPQNIKSVCEADPCHAAAKFDKLFGYSGSTCYYDETDLLVHTSYNCLTNTPAQPYEETEVVDLSVVE